MTTIRRLGLAAAVTASVAMSGCAMWQGFTERLGFGGGGERSATARSGAPGSGMTAGRETTILGGPFYGRVPKFSSYNECRQWFAGPGSSRELNHGVWTGGEVTVASNDPCLRPGGWS